MLNCVIGASERQRKEGIFFLSFVTFSLFFLRSRIFGRRRERSQMCRRSYTCVCGFFDWLKEAEFTMSLAVKLPWQTGFLVATLLRGPPKTVFKYVGLVFVVQFE